MPYAPRISPTLSRLSNQSGTLSRTYTGHLPSYEQGTSERKYFIPWARTFAEEQPVSRDTAHRVVIIFADPFASIFRAAATVRPNGSHPHTFVVCRPNHYAFSHHLQSPFYLPASRTVRSNTFFSQRCRFRLQVFV